MAYLGVSPEPLAAAVLHGGADAGSAASATVQLASAIRIALGDDARRCAADLAQVRPPAFFASPASAGQARL